MFCFKITDSMKITRRKNVHYHLFTILFDFHKSNFEDLVKTVNSKVENLDVYSKN